MEVPQSGANKLETRNPKIPEFLRPPQDAQYTYALSKVGTILFLKIDKGWLTL